MKMLYLILIMIVMINIAYAVPVINFDRECTQCIFNCSLLSGTCNNDSYVNSSDYWDNLDDPSDISAGDITDDGTYWKECNDVSICDYSVSDTCAEGYAVQNTTSIGVECVEITSGDFLNLSGTNANQNINISDYNFSSYKYTGHMIESDDYDSTDGNNLFAWDLVNSEIDVTQNVQITGDGSGDAFEIYQGGDSDGIQVHGYDDQSTKSFSMHVSSLGHGRFYSDDSMEFTVNNAGEYMKFTSKDDIRFQLGDSAADEVQIKDSGGNTVAFINSDGQIGIGRSPTTDVDVYTSSGAAEVLIESTAADNRPAFFLKNDQGNRARFFFYGSNYLIPRYQEQMRIHMDGGDDIFITGGGGLNIEADDAKLALGASYTSDSYFKYDSVNLDIFSSGEFDLMSDANEDIVLNFISTSNSGVLKWMEDEDYFEFEDEAKFPEINMTGHIYLNEYFLNLGQEGSYIYSSSGNLDLVSGFGKRINAYNDIYVIDNVSAETFIDRTPAWRGTSREALDALLTISSKNGEIDHKTLPDFVYVKEKDPEGNITEGRNIGAMITMLTEAIKALEAENAALDARIKTLEK